MSSRTEIDDDYASSDFDDSDDFHADDDEIEVDGNEQHSVYSDLQSVALDSTRYNDDTTTSSADLESVESISYTDPEIELTKLLNMNVYTHFEKARITKIKCLALCRIIYGERHWEVAEAHVQLANVYLKGKQYHQQVLKHTNIARDILLSAHKGDPEDDCKREYLLQNLYYLMGRVNYQLSKYKVSENHLMKAKLVSDHTDNATSKFLTMKINILSSLASTLSKLNQSGQAIEYIEEAIEIANKLSGSDKYLAINLYKQIITIELTNGENAHISFALESAHKALELSENFNGSDSAETAEILILLSRIEVMKDTPDYESIEKHLRAALAIYNNLENTAKVICSQKMICKLYMKQKKFPIAKSALKEAMKICEDAYGDMSLLGAELYELMGNILFAESSMSNALTYLLKADEILKGRKRYQDRQSKISKLIGIIKKSLLKSQEQKTKEKPRFT